MKKKATTQKSASKASKKPAMRDLTTLESRARTIKAGARAGRKAGRRG